jgi:hypothetical protein
MPAKKLYMETTEIPSRRTAAEITAALVEAGATQVASDYAAGEIVGLRWTMSYMGRRRAFAMPVRIDPIYEVFKSRLPAQGLHMSPGDRERLMAKATRVAWRQLLRWVQAQLAMVATGMLNPVEIFFAYLQDANSQTLYALFEGNQLKALAAPEQSQ